MVDVEMFLINVTQYEYTIWKRWKGEGEGGRVGVRVMVEELG